VVYAPDVVLEIYLEKRADRFFEIVDGKPQPKRETIDTAIRIIRPTRSRVENCRRAIGGVVYQLMIVDAYQRIPDHHKTKPAKKAASRLSLTFRRLERDLKDRNLDPKLARVFREHIPIERLKEFSQTCDETSKTPSGKLTRKDTEAKKLAVKQAHRLLKAFASSDVANDTTKGSRFCRLAGLLYGSKVNLQHQCKAFVGAP
jgi:hypothetical protein